MNLKDLIPWADELSVDREELKKRVRKEGDAEMCRVFLKEISNRGKLVLDATKKSENNMKDIETYLGYLKKRGITPPVEGAK